MNHEFSERHCSPAGRGRRAGLSRFLARSAAGARRGRGALRAGGYSALRSTFVERSNPGAAAQYLAMGGRPLHGYAFYEKDL